MIALLTAKLGIAGSGKTFTHHVSFIDVQSAEAIPVHSYGLHIYFNISITRLTSTLTWPTGLTASYPSGTCYVEMLGLPSWCTQASLSAFSLGPQPLELLLTNMARL